MSETYTTLSEEELKVIVDYVNSPEYTHLDSAVVPKLVHDLMALREQNARFSGALKTLAEMTYE